jgi:hypothetical protein
MTCSADPWRHIFCALKPEKARYEEWPAYRIRPGVRCFPDAVLAVYTIEKRNDGRGEQQ